MTDLGAFRPLSLVGAARRLEVHPFDLVRLLVACDALPQDLTLRPETLPQLARMAGLERWWDDGALEDVEPTPRGLAVAICGRLGQRAVDGPTRFDNVFRGLPAELQPVARRVVQRLTQAGLLAATPTPAGMHLAVAEGQAALVSAIGRGNVPGNLGL